MNNPMIKGNEVRCGTHIVLDALSKDVINSLGDDLLPEQLLHQVNDGGMPLFPMTAKDVAQSIKARGELVFAIRLLTDKTIIGMCSLNDVDWKSRHAQVQISIVHETYFTVEMLADVMQTVLQFAYWEANLNRIYVYCLEDHTLLQEALEQVGLIHEGQLRHEVYRNAHYLDQSIYSILRWEWSK